jgi:outer membrane protein assembly factor BamB
VNSSFRILANVSCFTIVTLAIAVSALAAEPATTIANAAAGTGWLGFRGDSSSASASSAPDKLALGDDGNLAWQLTLPGRSVAGPIVVGDLVVATGSSGQYGEVLHINGVDLATGQPRWEQTFRATGRPFCHPTSANAAPTPASDGERIYAFFSSNDLVCLSRDGDLLWYRGLGLDYPQAGNDVGMASSPIIVDGAVIVQVESQGDSFAIGIDTKTGQNLWRIDRPRNANWSSPVAIRRPDDRTEVILQSGNDVIAVDPRTGKQVWESVDGGSTIPSPTVTRELLLLPGNELTAVNYAASASTPQVVWSNSKLSPKNASIVATEDRVYSLKGSVLVAATIADGEVVWQQRLSGLAGTWATPVTAGGKIYVFDQKGVGLVIEDQGEAAETLSEVELGEPVLGSPAIAAGRLIVRGERTLFCFQ